MSNRKRPRVHPVRVRRSAPSPGPGQGYAVVPAIVPDRTVAGAVEHAQQVTHDELIRLWAHKRVSGIWWTDYIGDEAARIYEQLARIAQGPMSHTEDEPEPVVDQHLRGNPRGQLVVAWAIVTEGDTVVPPVAGWHEA